VPVVPINHAPDSVLQVLNVKINQQPNLLAAQAHVRKQLRFVDRIDRVNALDLNDHTILYNQVDSVTDVDLLAFVDHGQADLAPSA
jgi:hypothetical protein